MKTGLQNDTNSLQQFTKIVGSVVAVVTYTCIVVAFILRMQAEISLIRQKQDLLVVEVYKRLDLVEQRTKSSEDSINRLNISIERTNTILERIEKGFSN